MKCGIGENVSDAARCARNKDAVQHGSDTAVSKIDPHDGLAMKSAIAEIVLRQESPARRRSSFRSTRRNVSLDAEP
jgi:hypothetical protein